MRWQLTTWKGTLGAARTPKERDALAWAWLGGRGYLADQSSRDGIVPATDTRTGRVVELSRPLRRRTLKAPKAGG